MPQRLQRWCIRKKTNWFVCTCKRTCKLVGNKTVLVLHMSHASNKLYNRNHNSNQESFLRTNVQNNELAASSNFQYSKSTRANLPNKTHAYLYGPAICLCFKMTCAKHVPLSLTVDSVDTFCIYKKYIWKTCTTHGIHRSNRYRYSCYITRIWLRVSRVHGGERTYKHIHRIHTHANPKRPMRIYMYIHMHMQYTYI